MGKPVQNIVGGVGKAVGLVPDVPNMSLPAAAEAPEAPAPTDAGDPEARRVAAEKLAQERRRQGRRNLRIDLASPAQGVGAGVAIPT